MGQAHQEIEDIGGGDVFLAGRHASDEWNNSNIGIVRTGTISLMFNEEAGVLHRHSGKHFACFVLWLRSLSDFRVVGSVCCRASG